MATKLNPIIAAAVGAALTAAGNANGIPLDRAAVPAVTEAVVSQLQSDPVVLNETNSEKWWQSRVVLGGLVAAIAPVAALVFKQTLAPEDQKVIVDLLVAVGPVVGGLIALWGRLGKPKAPLGAAKP